VNYAAIGEEGARLSALGIGTAAMGRDLRGWGLTDDNESIAAIRSAIDAGMNWIDTSPDFGAGHAEQVVGAALVQQRDAVVIVGGCGAAIRELNGTTSEPASVTIRRSCEASLRRLRTDRLDLFMVHSPSGPEPIEEIAAALVALRQHGKVLGFGLSGVGCDLIARWRAAAPLHLVRGRLNLLESDALEDVVHYCSEHGVPFVACGPLCRGLLSGRHRLDLRFSDLRARDSQFLPPRYAANLELVETLRAIAQRHDRTPTQAAAAWVLSQLGVIAAAVGVKRSSQVRDLLGAVNWTWQADELAEISAALDLRKRRLADG